MSCNKYLPHLMVLVEDDANRQVANGFLTNPALVTRSIQVLPSAGGWKDVIDEFNEVHALEMRRYAERRMLLVVDCDGMPARRPDAVKGAIPEDLVSRVFVLGARTTPEVLRSELGMGLEDIGRALAHDCYRNARTTWECPALAHNVEELERLAASVRCFLFA